MTALKWSDFRTLDSDRLAAIANERLPKWVTLLLIAAIGWQLARILWMLVPGSSLGDPIETRPSGSGIAAGGGTGRSAENRADVGAIAAAHLFGEAKAATAPPPVEAVPEDLAETRLNLSLKGTIAADEGSRSMAIIAAAGRDEMVYAINDTVVQGTTLHAVYPDRVILNRGGALEALKLPKEFQENSPPAVRRSIPSTNRTTDGTGSIQQVVTQNVTKLADVIRPTPYFVGGEQQGYRVYPGRNRKQFAALGLRPGDLIKDINGASLTDPQQAMEIFQNLGSADQVTVTVERNGQPQVLTLSTSQLTLDDEE
ncbi:MAG TPA: type II secretion system protein GspC [Woeseiaceae bacterium]|jgi:general secretion pathway protein C|nr:type II secretion system protein GspC [Woeseiaceae bacterium]